MTKVLSKSIIIMFIFDLLILLGSTSFWSKFLGLTPNLGICVITLTLVTGLCVLFLKGNYRIREFNVRLKNSYLLLEGVIFAHVPAAIIFSLFARNLNSLEFVVFNILSVFVLLQTYRILFHFYLFKFKPAKNILIIGANKNGKFIANEIINKKALRMNVVGLVEDAKSKEEFIQDDLYKVFKQPVDLAELIKTHNVDIVIVAINKKMDDGLLSKMIFGIPNNVKIYTMPDFYEMVTHKYFVDSKTINMLFRHYMRNRSYVYDFCKRTFDIISALIILTLTFPILLYIGIRVKMTDGGEAIYTQTRIGRGGKPFKMYKLRTMYKNDYRPENGQIGHTEGQDNDDRVIPFCKFVRKARFDEIPQMINILKGEMSIVGPRTEWEDLVKIYSKQVPYYTCRQWVNTGWTGWAQINQGHCVLADDIAEKLQYDLYYLKHRNVLWEIGILVKAVFLALGGRHG